MATTIKKKPAPAQTEAERLARLRERAEALTDARKAAESVSQERSKAVKDAAVLHATLTQRVSAGDASITSLQLLSAEADIARTAELVRAAEADVATARTAEGPVRARYVAAHIDADVDLAELNAKVEETVLALTSALDGVVTAVEARNVTIKRTIGQLGAAGADHDYVRCHEAGEAGHEEPLEAWVGAIGGRQALRLSDGRTITPMSAAVQTFAVVERAVRGVGMRFTPQNERVNLEAAPNQAREQEAVNELNSIGANAAREAREDRAAMQAAADAARLNTLDEAVAR